MYRDNVCTRLWYKTNFRVNFTWKATNNLNIKWYCSNVWSNKKSKKSENQITWKFSGRVLLLQLQSPWERLQNNLNNLFENRNRIHWGIHAYWIILSFTYDLSRQGLDVIFGMVILWWINGDYHSPHSAFNLPSIHIKAFIR